MAIILPFGTKTIMVFNCVRININIHSPCFKCTISSITHVRALCREGRLKEAVNILLTTHNPPEDSQTYLRLLQTCIVKKALSEGKLIHTYINDRGFTFATHTILQNQFINMYDKCGSLVDARKVFEDMSEPDVFSWNTIIAAHRRHGLPQEALTLFYQMQRTSLQPDQFTFASILPVCAKMEALEQGTEIHKRVIESGFMSDVVVANTLTVMYVKCGSVQKARQLFDKMPQRDVFSWTAMIQAYAQIGVLEEAFRLFKEMPQQNAVSWNSMIVGYAQNGLLDKALRLFEEMPQRDVVSWNAIIAGYAQNGLVEKALEILRQMQLEGVKPNTATFVSILPACAKMGTLEHGMKIHQRVIECSFMSDTKVVTSLIDMFAKFGSVQKARQLFDKIPQRDAITWNTMISGYVQNGVLEEALRLFNEMPQQNTVSSNVIIAGYAQNGLVEKALEIFNQMQRTGVQPNQFTFASILPACAKMGALEQGAEIHQRIIENGFLLGVIVVNALIDMYAKCGSIQKARILFDKMSRRDAVSWNAMIAGYVQNGILDEALRLFKEMPQRNVVSWNAIIAGYAQIGLGEKALEIFKETQRTGVQPDHFIFASILPVCAKLGALEQGMVIHQRIIESGFLSDVVLVTALIDMYAKCGSIQKARNLFEKIHHPNLVSWTAMIAGYAMHGYGKDALKLFESMKHSGTNPSQISLVCVLFACSHAGLVDEGCKYFNQMSDSYSILPTMDHYICMVDILGRAGYLKEALNFIIKMPIIPHVVVWMSLLGACKSHKITGLGEFVAKHLFDLDLKNAAPYVLLSNIYADVGRWGDVQKVWKLFKDRGIKKTPGCSWIEVHKVVHAFVVGDRSHPQTQEIYAKLEKLYSEMKAEGYILDSRLVLNDVEEEEKELFLGHHSEMLAIAFGLLNTSSQATIRIVKNLRVCVDCHTATKFISKIVLREIVVRDVNRFHHFKSGQCSCGDYW